ncbi:MAG: SH3 domain-containing protein, partial [Candidatus Limnocylindrales bacterium]
FIVARRKRQRPGEDDGETSPLPPTEPLGPTSPVAPTLPTPPTPLVAPVLAAAPVPPPHASPALLGLAAPAFRRGRAAKPPVAVADDVMAADLAAAATAAGVPAAADMMGPAADEATMPRWRRPSLKAARLASDRKPVETVPLAFGAAAALDAGERRRVRYAVVPLVDAPDEIRSTEIGQLQQGDEVELLSSDGRWMRVRTPIGTVGWVHKTTLGPIPDAAAMPAATETADAPEADGATLLDQAISRAASRLALQQSVPPTVEPATPKPKRAPRRSRGTASAG